MISEVVILQIQFPERSTVALLESHDLFLLHFGDELDRISTCISFAALAIGISIFGRVNLGDQLLKHPPALEVLLELLRLKLMPLLLTLNSLCRHREVVVRSFVSLGTQSSHSSLGSLLLINALLSVSTHSCNRVAWAKSLSKERLRLKRVRTTALINERGHDIERRVI